MAEAAATVCARPSPRRRTHALAGATPCGISRSLTTSVQVHQADLQQQTEPGRWRKPKWLTKRHHIAALVFAACAVPLVAGWAVLDGRCSADLAALAGDAPRGEGRDFTQDEQSCRVAGAPKQKPCGAVWPPCFACSICDLPNGAHLRQVCLRIHAADAALPAPTWVLAGAPARASCHAWSRSPLAALPNARGRLCPRRPLGPERSMPRVLGLLLRRLRPHLHLAGPPTHGVRLLHVPLGLPRRVGASTCRRTLPSSSRCLCRLARLRRAPRHNLSCCDLRSFIVGVTDRSLKPTPLLVRTHE